MVEIIACAGSQCVVTRFRLLACAAHVKRSEAFGAKNVAGISFRKALPPEGGGSANLGSRTKKTMCPAHCAAPGFGAKIDRGKIRDLRAFLKHRTQICIGVSLCTFSIYSFRKRCPKQMQVSLLHSNARVRSLMHTSFTLLTLNRHKTEFLCTHLRAAIWRKEKQSNLHWSATVQFYLSFAFLSVTH